MKLISILLIAALFSCSKPSPCYIVIKVKTVRVVPRLYEVTYINGKDTIVKRQTGVVAVGWNTCGNNIKTNL